MFGLVRQPGWLSPKSCKMLGILRFQAEVVRKLEVSEQLFYFIRFIFVRPVFANSSRL
jgi:hypothetical protein